MLDVIGWVATAIFAGSYFCKRPASLRRVQALAALVWIGYGVGIGAVPLIVANVIVGVLALYSSWRPAQPEGVAAGRERVLEGSESL
jgi:hypothetical protein